MSENKSNTTLKNKEIIHIAVELVCFLGLSYYFSRRINVLNNKVDLLVSKIEEQQTMINKHEDIIMKLIENNSTIFSAVNQLQNSRENIKHKVRGKMSNKKQKEKTERVEKPKMPKSFQYFEEEILGSLAPGFFSFNVNPNKTSSNVIEINEEENVEENMDDINNDKNVEELEENLDKEIEEELKELD